MLHDDTQPLLPWWYKRRTPPSFLLRKPTYWGLIILSVGALLLLCLIWSQFSNVMTTVHDTADNIVMTTLHDGGHLVYIDDLPHHQPLEIPNMVFIGHQQCDTDSLVSAIAAASLYKGRAARCEQDLNRETQFVLHKFGIPIPPMTSDQLFQGDPNVKWGLVDHADQGLVPGGVNKSAIVMVIDHHWLSDNNVVVDEPIFVDMRPWGSCSTIVAFKFFEEQRHVPTHLAGLLMAAILSDTMNLRSTTTKQEDRDAVAHLKIHSGINDTDSLAMEMFEAKSNVQGLTIDQILASDFKNFVLPDGTKLGFGNGNTVRPEYYTSRATEFCDAITRCKASKQLDLVFLAVTDMMKMESLLFTCGDKEKEVATKAYGGAAVPNQPMLMNVGQRVSRKNDFLPPLTALFPKKTQH